MYRTLNHMFRLLEKLPNSAIFQKVLLLCTLSQNEIGENDLQWETPAQTLGQLKNAMPYLLESAPKRQNDIIVRPHGTTAQLIQLDDLKTEALDREV